MRKFKNITLSLLIVLLGMVLISCRKKDKAKPIITGYQDWEITEGDPEPNYLEGVLVTDNVDENIKPVIKSNTVIRNVAGDYEVVITATDRAGNIASVTIKVKVLQKEEPLGFEAILLKEAEKFNLYVRSNDEVIGLIIKFGTNSTDLTEDDIKLFNLPEDWLYDVYVNNGIITIATTGNIKLNIEELKILVTVNIIDDNMSLNIIEVTNM